MSDDASFEYNPEDFEDFDSADMDGFETFGSFEQDSWEGSMDFTEDSIDDPNILLENQYLEAKDYMEDLDDQSDALVEFRKVLELEQEKMGEKGKWGFRALKWIVKVNFSIGQHNEMIESYKQLLTDYDHLLVENERALNKLFDYLSTSPLIKELFTMTFDKLEERGNKKASLRLELKLAKILLKRRDLGELDQLLDSMHLGCKQPDGTDDPSKGNQLYEIYAMKIERHLRSPNPNMKILKGLYDHAVNIKALANPRYSGIIYEAGGKIYLTERLYEQANTDFIEAFKGYDIAGARDLAVQCLKYLVLANMLSSSNINPFSEPRAKSYEQNKDIQAMNQILNAYQEGNIGVFESTLRRENDAIMSDPFISEYISDLFKKLRSHVLQRIIKPYRNIKLPYLERQLNVQPGVAESLLVELILDNEIFGKIDQIQQLLMLEGTVSGTTGTYSALQGWTKSLSSLEKSTFSRVN
eukprot:TRINITY_DN329_c0_g1_i1.p1 TRINITY_DN329_c0_g1~~TRINITY_DN329_c0_g1_i1.p1  ORF type:complete len:470 (-),score=123.59 TRINITY_DN329_c0_g1_i1:62-1471(-)